MVQVLQYSKSRKHVEPLWFSAISTSIMWWTYVKAFWRAVSSVLGFQNMAFKTTLKVRLGWPRGFEPGFTLKLISL